MIRRALLVSVSTGWLLLGAGAAAGQAATVEVIDGTEGIRYLAAPGERNDLRFDEIEDSWPTAFLVSDPGATITAGADCVPVDAHRAACISRSGSMYNLSAQLGDGDDVLHPAGFHLVRAGGGAGNDRLMRGTWDDVLDGGGGTDELRGGDGSDVLRDGDRIHATTGETLDADILDGGDGQDWVSYEQRREGVTVDLSDPGPDGAGERDLLSSIENVHGGRGNDRLTGDDGPNVFDDEGGNYNVFFGRGGDDYFLSAAAGPVDCGSGADAVRGVTRRSRLDPSCETVLRAVEDSDLEVRAYPRRRASGMTLPMQCPSFDGEPITCSGRVTIETLSRTLATGKIPRGTGRRTVRLRLTRAGGRILADRAVAATIQIRGTGLPDMAWGVTLGQRR